MFLVDNKYSTSYKIDENDEDGLNSRENADAASDPGSKGDEEAFSFLDASKITDEEELALSMSLTSITTQKSLPSCFNEQYKII